jgi:hypothetical protein
VEYVAVAICFGLATGIVARIKGSSFVVWFLIGTCVPIVGLIAALLYRWESAEPRRRCPRCGAVRPISDQVCTSCGEDMAWPEPDEILPSRAATRELARSQAGERSGSEAGP